MKGLFDVLGTQNQALKDAGLFVLRVGIGLMFIKLGFGELIKGTEGWAFLGNAMKHLGITFAPHIWGLMAALSEAIGGIMLVVGFGTRIASFFLACVMFVAFMMHIGLGDAWSISSHPLSLLIVFVSLMIAGSGTYSLDNLFFRD